MQKAIELKLYSTSEDKICYTFQPVIPNESLEWNPQWEEWHSYENPLRVFLMDYKRLLKQYIDLMYPTVDAYEKSPQVCFDECFDECFDNWLSKSDIDKMLCAIEKDLKTMESGQICFYQTFINWFKRAFERTEMFVIESNR